MIVDKVAFLIPLVILVLTRFEYFEPYVVFWCVSKTCSLSYCVWHSRDILGVKLFAANDAIRASLQSVKVGIVLTLANISSLLILGVLRFAIDFQWDITIFGKVSLSITLMNFFLSMISQVAMVLFPVLRRVDKQEQATFFALERDILGIILPASYLLYIPMCCVISAWLPQYEISLEYFALLLPLCLYDGKMNLISTTFMKVLRMERNLLGINFVAVIMSCICVYLGIWNMQSIEITIILIDCVIILRSLYSEIMLMHQFNQKLTTDIIWELLMTAGFLIVATEIGYSLESFALILVLYLGFLLLCKRRVQVLVKKLGRKPRKTTRHQA